MNLIYSEKVKFLKGHYQNKVGTYIDENHDNYLIAINNLFEIAIVTVSKYKTDTIIEKI